MSKEFPSGLNVKPKHEKAPDYVIANISINKKDFIEWLQKQPEEWVNIGINLGQSGKPYAYKDTWKPS